MSYNLLHMLRQFYVKGEDVRNYIEWLIRRLIKAGTRVSYHARGGSFTWPWPSRWHTTTAQPSAMGDTEFWGSAKAPDPEKEVAFHLKTE